MKSILLFCSLALLVVSSAIAQQQPAYWLAFHACEVDECRNPRSHQVYLAQSDDGVLWKLVPGWQPFVGSVPDVIRRGDTLYIYTARAELVRYHLDTRTQDAPVPVEVVGLDTGYADPSLILNEDGQLVLFMLNGFVPGGDPARCPRGETSCEKYIDSATEVMNSEGTRFVLDSGHRLTVELGAGSFQSVSDPDIFFDGDQYVLYLSHGASVSVWTAIEIQSAYELVGILSENCGGVPAGYFDPEGEAYWTYAHVFHDGASVIRRAVHETLVSLPCKEAWEIVVSAESIGLDEQMSIESPGFAVNIP